MEENTNTAFFTFDSPKGQSSYIKVIGVGGGGNNAVNHMYREGIEGVDFIVCNTDMKALNASPVPNKIPLGNLGLGAGNKPERARMAATAKENDIREALSHNTQMLFITAGMGGGTGTGAAPVIAEIAKSIDLDNDENKKILVVAIVTRPFSFEGNRRREQAEAGIQELRKHVDSIIVINNDKLRSKGNFGLSTAFGMADDVLLTAAKGIAEIITENAYVNRDFQDVNTVMEHSGTALMGTGSGKGENRAMQAIEAATTSELLDDSDISGAKNVLLYFSYSNEHELTMDEMSEITDYVLDKTNGTADIIWGAGPDDSLGDELKVILIATGFEKGTKAFPAEPKRYELLPDSDAPQAATKAETKADADGMRVIQLDESPVAFEAPQAFAIPETVIIPEAVTIADPVTAEEPVAEVTFEPETIAEPVAEVTFEPVADVTPEPAPEPAGKRVFVLEDDEPVVQARPVRNIRAGSDEFRTEIDTMVEDIRIVQSEPEPVAEPVAVKHAEPFRSAFENDNDVTTAADRIRRIHDLLRNNSNGADIVQSMKTEQIAGESLFEGQSSAAREASSLSMRADGTIAKNPYLYGNQPD